MDQRKQGGLKIVPHASVELEQTFTRILEGLGLRGWTLVWQPDSTQPNKGRILPEPKVIVIHDKEPEAAFRTLLHEVLELRLRAASNMERTLSNVLINWANEQIYNAKERAIEEVLDLVFSLVETSDDFKNILEGTKGN